MSKDDFTKVAGRKGPALPALDDEALLDLVQSRTLEYFRAFAHPGCGMARERSNAGPAWGYDQDCVTTGGTGFGIMALIAGAERGFVPKDEVLAQVNKIVDFLGKADRFHGVFPHFMDGNTGKVVPFSPKDNGGDLVETSFLMMGLLTARQYFSDPAHFSKPAEAALLSDKINKLWEEVEWDWHVRGKDLLWHWSPNHNWEMNHPIQGWNECLITHVLAAASPTHPVPKEIYQQGWTSGHGYKNGASYDGVTLPLGPAGGGPLFFTHYSFLGLNPKELKDPNADYWEQNRNHALVNRAHCLENPNGFKGYGANCWGLTACDSPDVYGAHSPTNDKGVIAPTAALSSFPYTPVESMQALRHFYEDLGDKIWGKYGFTDSFCESKDWYAQSHLAIDQGPIVAMIENHRSGLLWNLFMSCPEVRPGLDKLGFEPHVDKGPAPAVKPVFQARPASPPPAP